MTDGNRATNTVGRIAVLTGIAGFLALVFIVLFFAVGGTFGTLNDLFNALLGVASGAMAWSLYAGSFGRRSPAGLIGLALALAGAAITVTGSVLIIFDFTGWLLAGLYTAVGAALIGIWLILFCSSTLRDSRLPRQLARFGLVTGVFMAFGTIDILGIVASIDTPESMPWYLNLGAVGFLGTYLLYPLWSILLGRMLLFR